MTVENPAKRHDYEGNGATTAFDYTNKISNQTHLKVIHTNSSGTPTELTVGTDYAVTNVGVEGGGNITFPEAGSSFSTLASEEFLAILYVFPGEQTTDIPNTGRVFNESVEDALDYLTILHIQQEEVSDRNLKYSESTNISNISTELPAPAATKLLGWKTDETGLENVDRSTLSSILVAGNYKTETFTDGVDYTAGVSNSITLVNDPGVEDNTQIYFDGIYQEKTEYSLSGFVITFTTPIPSGVSSIEVVTAGALEVNVPASGSVVADSIQNNAVTLSKLASLANLKVIGNTSGGAATPGAVSILDEDDMAADSATSLATQQSIKAYVDGQTVTLLDEDDMSSDSDTQGATQQSIKAYVDNNSSATIVQAVDNSVASTTSGSGLIPFDDTKPQSSEGVEAITVSITPTNASNKLRIRGQINVSAATTNFFFITALFQDSNTNAIHVSTSECNNTDTVAMGTLNFEYIMTAGTTSATTFKVRVGTSVSSTVYLNSNSSGRIFGGALAHTLTVEEIKV